VNTVSYIHKTGGDWTLRDSVKTPFGDIETYTAVGKDCIIEIGVMNDIVYIRAKDTRDSHNASFVAEYQCGTDDDAVYAVLKTLSFNGI
jgi:hypothetical protein